MENTWIDFKSKKVLVNDYTGIKMEKDMILHLHEFYKLLQVLEPGAELLVLLDFSGTFVTPGFLEVARKYEKEVMDKHKAKRAVLGVTGAKEVLLKGFNLFTKNKLTPFQNRQHALDYLVK
jgi:hypothetical protein